MSRPYLFAIVLALPLALLLWASPVGAQEFSVGVIGGLHLNDDFRSRPDQSGEIINPPSFAFLTRESSSFTPRFGPKIEVDFSERWSLEADVLFHRPVWTNTVTYDPPIPLRPGGQPESKQVDRFDHLMTEIPVLLKRRVRLGGAGLVLEAGPAFLPFGGYDNPGRVGLTAGVGTTLQVGRVRLEPVLRYSRWPRSPEERASPFGSLPFRRDMVSLLVGADIPSRSLGRGDGGPGAFSVGFIGGTTLTKGFPAKNGFEGLTTRMAGLAIEYQWSERWGVELDALYHPLILSERARATVLTWELPALAKYRLGTGRVRPVLLAGPTFRLAGNQNSSNPSGVGVAAGAGVEMRWGRLSVSPTVRYVRWARDAVTEMSPGLSRQDQVQALVRIAFGGR